MVVNYVEFGINFTVFLILAAWKLFSKSALYYVRFFNAGF